MVHLIFALFSFACALAMPLIVLVLGEQWREAVPLFQVLTLGGIFQTAAYATYWVFLARGLMRAQLVYSLVSRVLLIACIFVGSRWGAMGVAIGYSFGLLLTWPLSLIWIGKISDAPVGALFTNAMRAMTAYGIAGGCAYYASITVGGPLWEQLAVGAAAMAAVCLLALAIWPAFRRDVIAIINIRRLLMQAKARR